MGLNREAWASGAALGAAVLLLFLVLTHAAYGDPPGKQGGTSCRVGERAAFPSTSVLKEFGLGVLAPPTVVGCGRSDFGRVILVAYEYKRPAEFCFGVSLPRLGTQSGGDCKPLHEAWTDFRCPTGFCVITAFGDSWRPKLGYRATVVSGISTAPVRDLKVIAARSGRRLETGATTASISGPMAERFHLTESFTLFGTAIPCVVPRTVYASGLDQSGAQVLASRTEYPQLGKHPCHPPSTPAGPAPVVIK